MRNQKNNTVKLGDKEQMVVKEPFLVAMPIYFLITISTVQGNFVHKKESCESVFYSTEFSGSRLRLRSYFAEYSISILLCEITFQFSFTLEIFYTSKVETTVAN